MWFYTKDANAEAYPAEAFAKDMVENLNTETPPRPWVHNPPSSKAGRCVAGKATRRWRAFNKSALRTMMRGGSKAERRTWASQVATAGLTERDFGQYLRRVETLLRGYGPSEIGAVFKTATQVAKYLDRVPPNLTFLVRKRCKAEVEPCEEPSDLAVLRTARRDELGREFWLPDDLYYERWARHGLTELQWQRETETSQHLKVVILVDSSGSMHGDPHAFAAACAIRMGEKAEANGHEVVVRFYHDEVTGRLAPNEVLEALARNMDKEDRLIKGTNDLTGLAFRVADQEDKPDAVVLISDLHTELVVDLTSDVKYAPLAELHTVRIGNASGHNQVFEEISTSFVQVTP